jgi:site-specific DNA-cytosine methylase
MSTEIKHSTIVPLIGGMPLASESVFGRPPEYILSYKIFENNEKHLRNYYKQKGYEIPYYVIDSADFSPKIDYVDVVSVCAPCAGLSNYHFNYGEHNQNNQWMEKTTKFVLEQVRPKVLWGENAPVLATNVGKFMRDKLKNISSKAGYNMTIYITKSLLHGTPQIRRRSFYFFWRKDAFDNSVPVFKTFNRKYLTIRELICGIRSNFQVEPINKKIPSKDDPFYRYFLTEVKGGISHTDFALSLNSENFERPSYNVEAEMLQLGITYEEIGKWMRSQGLNREADKCQRRHDKLSNGKGVMFRGTVIPVDHIGAFVVHMPFVVTHPVEDRYINYREAMTIMGLPQDFELLDPEKSVNHICQNVPFLTARDMASEVLAALEGKRNMEKASYLLQDNLSGTLREKESNSSLMDFII